MLSNSVGRLILTLGLSLLMAISLATRCFGRQNETGSMLANPGFEYSRQDWHLDTAGGTDARFAIEHAFLVDAFRLYEGEYVPYEEAKVEEVADARVSLFDTGVSMPGPLSPEILSKKAGWTQPPEDETDHDFQGDAVFMNNRLVVRLRSNGPGAEVYTRDGRGLVRRAVVAPASTDGDLKLESVQIADNNPAVAAVDAAFRAHDGKLLELGYELEMGQVFVKTQAARGVSAVRIEAPSRFVVLPDFFADDIVVDANEIPMPTAELPSENFLLHMLGDGEAILMSVSNYREQDARVRLAGEAPERVITGSEIPCGKDGKTWIALLSGQDVWHVHHVAEGDAGKIVDLDWTAPYAAQWRVDWQRADGITGSWEMIAQKSNGEYTKHGWFGRPQTIDPSRRRWTTVLGRFEYPCWIDVLGQGFLQPLGRHVSFQGPAVVYPINRVAQTPLSEFTVVDVLRATLGVGPCEYILDVEGQPTAMKGRATCATRDTLNPIYAAGRQKSETANIRQALDEVLVFVTHIRSRIEGYVDFGHEMLIYLDMEKKKHPELSDFISEMETLTRKIDEYFTNREDKIQTPKYVADLTEKFCLTLLDYQGPDALEKCKAITGAIVVVGGNQDELVGECRMAVKILRQKAALAMATNPQTAPIAREIRRRTQDALRNPTSYEAPRH